MSPKEAKIGQTYRMTTDWGTCEWPAVTVKRKTRLGIVLIDHDAYDTEFSIEYNFLGKGHHLHPIKK